jgi:hypothetical protein
MVGGFGIIDQLSGMKKLGSMRVIVVALVALAQLLPAYALDNDVMLPVGYAEPRMPSLSIPEARARMAPDLALAHYESNARWQSQQLGETSDTTTITADLPDAAKHGQYRLLRAFSAPKSVAFKTISFVGDNFVKTNVIARLLQSEVNHVEKDQPSDTAISRDNYKFNFKGTQQINGRTAHVFQVKPRRKAAGLFKGKIYIDAYSGNMVRAEGQVVKSPSLFIKKIEFTQDYQEVGEFNLISHVHSVAQTRLIGRAVVDIRHEDYQVHSLAQLQVENWQARQSAGLLQISER